MAPAGYGKTVACASWAVDRRPSGRLAWITLDEGDRTRERFWKGVMTALQMSGRELLASGDAAANRELVNTFIAKVAEVRTSAAVTRQPASAGDCSMM